MERDVLEMNSLQNNFVAHPLAILCVTPEIWIYLDFSYKSADFEGELMKYSGESNLNKMLKIIPKVG